MSGIKTLAGTARIGTDGTLNVGPGRHAVVSTDIADELRILRVKDVTRRTGLSRTTLWRLERVGEFPARRRLSSNAVGWIAAEVDAWIRARDYSVRASNRTALRVSR